MAKAKEVLYCNERYRGSLTEDECDILEQLIDLDAQNGCVVDLKHCIYDIAESEVIDFIEDMETYGQAFHQMNYTYGTLRDEQTIGVCFMYWANRCILGDSVGMGKTVETAGLANLFRKQYNDKGKQFRYLVLTEKDLCSQFRTELVKFTGSFVTLIPDGLQRTVDKFISANPYQFGVQYDVVGTHALLTTPSFIMWLEQCRTLGNGFPFDCLVVDESYIFGNSSTNTVAGFKAIEKYFKHVYFLNATPFDTKLEIFYNQLDLLDHKLLPTKTNFQKEYCLMDYRGMYPKPTGRYKNASQFKKLVGYRYFARTRRAKGAVMEDCNGRVVLSPLSPVQKKWLERSQLHRMVYDCPNYLDPTIEFNSENVPKLASLSALLNNECADAETIIIFSPYKEAQASLSEWLHKKGYSNRVLNGDTDKVVRQETIKGFKNKEFKVLITNVQRGLNFGNCNHCIFYSFDPNPSRMIQFEGRITRSFDIIGKNVFVLCSQGKEYKQLNTSVRQRAKATAESTNTDLSIIMDILLGVE